MTLIRMKKLRFLLIMLGGLVPASTQAEDAPATRPNLIFIYTDDMRWDAMGVVQHEIGPTGRFPWLRTPHLDRMAAEGLRFRNGFVATAVCSPSRAEFLSGRYGHFNGVASNHMEFPEDSVSFGSELTAAGYDTAYVGKWHMGRQTGKRPGFGYSASYVGQGRYEDCPFEIDGVRAETTGWIDDVATDFAIEFIEREREEPFALVLGFKSPHVPFIPPPRAKDRYVGERIGPASNFHDHAPFRKPEPGPKGRPIQPGWVLDYLRCISAIDDNVGRVMATLWAEGIADNTVVVFSSDNGYYIGEHGLGDEIGDKRSAYEEAMRVPLLVWYPPMIEAGSVSDEMAVNIDLASTFLDLAGVEIPAEFQGRSWVPVMQDPTARLRDVFFYEYFWEHKFWETPTLLALRTPTHKLIKYPGHEEWTELFDLETDPFERNNLAHAAEHQALRQQMEQAFRAEQEEVGYHVPDYAEKPAATGAFQPRRKQVYPWQKRERNEEIFAK